MLEISKMILNEKKKHTNTQTKTNKQTKKIKIIERVFDEYAVCTATLFNPTHLK